MLKSHPIQPASLLRSILLGRLRWRVAVLALALISSVLGLFAPFAQKEFIDRTLAGHSAPSWAFAAFGLTLGAHILSQFGFWVAMREAIFSQKSMGDAAYARVLEGPGGLIGRRPSGEAVSLFAVDVPGASSLLSDALTMASAMFFPILLAPLALQLAYGIPALATFAYIGVLSVICLSLAWRQSRFFVLFKSLAAERTGLVAEWIQNIRTLRILGWTSSTEKKIFEVRQRETRNRKAMVTNGQVMNAIAHSSTFALNIFAIMILLRVRGTTPTPGELLSLLWMLGVFLARPLRQLPWAFVMAMDAFTSIRRLETAFQRPIIQPVVNHPAASPTRSSPGPALEIRRLNLQADGNTLLEEIDLKVAPRELVAIVGEVGSGKSVLLQSLAGGTGAEFERFMIDGEDTQGPGDPKVRQNFALVPQEGFTMSASLFENVQLDYANGATQSESTARATESLMSAQFHIEGERMPHGIETEIGERGVNLSGGQRQRIGLARAHFTGRKIILMDDCLSAVDVETEKLLIESLICGDWSQNTRILATHRLSILPSCDRVIFLENGKIALQGKYERLLGLSESFREFVRREATRTAEKQVEKEVSE